MAKRVGLAITHNDVGGAQQAITRLGRELQRRRYAVELVFLYRKGSVTPSDLPYRFILDSEDPGLSAYASMPLRLYAWLRQFNPDALISFLPLANVVAQTTAALSGVAVRVASQRNPVSTYSWMMRALDWFVGTCGSYSHNILNSADVRSSVDFYPRPYRSRTRVVYNGVPKFEPTLDRVQARRSLGLCGDEMALVSVGRLTRQKNHVFLVQLLGALDHFVLLIAGEGPERAMLLDEAGRLGVRDRLRLLGPLDRVGLSTLLTAADIFGLPSLYEGQSNSLLEAMAAGRPVIASDLVCHRETLHDGEREAGWVIPITEPDRWIQTLSALGRDEALRSEYSKRARRRIEFFSLERMCSGFESCFAAKAPM